MDWTHVPCIASIFFTAVPNPLYSKQTSQGQDFCYICTLLVLSYFVFLFFFFWISHYLEAGRNPNLSPITNNRNLSSFAHCIWVSESVRKHHIAEPGVNQCLTHTEKRQRKICFSPGHSSVKADETLLAAVTGQLAFTHPSCVIAWRTSSPPWRRQNGEVGQVQMMYTLKQNQGTHSEFETDNRPSTGCGDSYLSVRNDSRPKAHSDMAVCGSKTAFTRLPFSAVPIQNHFLKYYCKYETGFNCHKW